MSIESLKQKILPHVVVCHVYNVNLSDPTKGEWKGEPRFYTLNINVPFPEWCKQDDQLDKGGVVRKKDPLQSQQVSEK